MVLATLCWVIVRDRPSFVGEPESGGPKFDRTVVLNSLLAVVRNRST